MTVPRLRPATADDAAFIADLLNHSIRTSTACWHHQPVDADERRRWLAQRAAIHPVLICELDGDAVGFGALSAFRPFAAYDRTVEHSLYVRADRQRRGLGGFILDALVKRATALGHHVMVAAISADQEPSLALHRSRGFIETGRLPQVGRKFDRWLDLVLMQRMLPPTPERT
jgi:phosphinothricin acetyltransferase